KGPDRTTPSFEDAPVLKAENPSAKTHRTKLFFNGFFSSNPAKTAHPSIHPKTLDCSSDSSASGSSRASKVSFRDGPGFGMVQGRRDASLDAPIRYGVLPALFIFDRSSQRARAGRIRIAPIMLVRNRNVSSTPMSA